MRMVHDLTLGSVKALGEKTSIMKRGGFTHTPKQTKKNYFAEPWFAKKSKISAIGRNKKKIQKENAYIQNRDYHEKKKKLYIYTQ